MFGSSMLDIAIGIVFIFLLLSILATAINEIILSYVNLRGKYLLNGIRSLLNEDNEKSAMKLVTLVYNHGQVCGLYKGDFSPTTHKHLPSYIPSRNFALALIGVLEEFGESLQAPAVPEAPSTDSVPPPPDSGFSAAALSPGDPTTPAAAPATPSAAASAAVTAAVSAAVTAAVATPGRSGITIPPGIRAAAAHLILENPKVGRPLVAMMKMAGHDGALFQKAIENWYNSGMDRVSGWYKYRTQWILFFIGLVMAVLLNASTIHIVRQLSVDPTMRQTMVAAAQSAKPPAASADTSMGTQLAAARASFSDIHDLGIPLGWPRPYSGGKDWFEAILGWLITAVAVSLGAPFWFDILNKIMVIRSTVKPAEKSHDEASKDKS